MLAALIPPPFFCFPPFFSYIMRCARAVNKKGSSFSREGIYLSSHNGRRKRTHVGVRSYSFPICNKTTKSPNRPARLFWKWNARKHKEKKNPIPPGTTFYLFTCGSSISCTVRVTYLARLLILFKIDAPFLEWRSRIFLNFEFYYSILLLYENAFIFVLISHNEKESKRILKV